METSEDLKVTIYPYLGYSPNLIDYFLIAGFEKNFIKNEILQDVLYKSQQDYVPSILNTITSRGEGEMLDNGMILKLIFPQCPHVITTHNLQYEPPNSTLVFFLNCDTLSAQSKVPYNGCCLQFYESFVLNSTKVFVPKVFCVVSQYPFFTFFSNLLKEILVAFKSKNEVPLEVVLYNLVNAVPSPINFDVQLQVFPKELKMYKSSSFSSSHSTQKGFSWTSSQCPALRLTGYPVFDFRLAEIFNVLPMPILTEILIFTFLEADMIFFSSNLEVLNITMFIIANLNYPGTDSNYFWHILSVSREELTSEDPLIFVIKPMPSMLGVNCTYENTIDTSKRPDSHFIVDIDNRNFFLKPSDYDDNEDVNNMIYLHNYIKNIVKDSQVQSNFLSWNIRNLLREVEVITKHLHYNQPSQSKVNFFEVNEETKILNQNTQEAFYEFILNLLSVFYNNYFLNSSFDRSQVEGQNSNFFIHYNEDLSKLSKEEIIFYNFFKRTNKYNNYILNFIQEFKCINLYKTPLIFSEEFIYLTKNNDDKQMRLRLFEIIDEFYQEVYSSDTTLVNFNSFYSFYSQSLVKSFFEEVEEDEDLQISLSKISAFNSQKYLYEYEYVELDNGVLFKYLHRLNNMDETTQQEILPWLNKAGLAVKQVSFESIVNNIERNLIASKVLKCEELVIFSLILVFIVTRSVCNFNESISHLRDILEILESKNLFLRKYISLTLENYNVSRRRPGLNQNTIRKYAYTKKMCNFIIINFLRNKNILPNEQMMKLFEKFTLENEAEEDQVVPEILMEDNVKQPHDLEKYNLYLQFHTCRCGAKKPDYFMRLAESANYEGDLTLDCANCKISESRTSLVFVFQHSPEKIISEIYSPLKLYSACLDVYYSYQQSLDFASLDKDSMNKILINIIFYCKNLKIGCKFLLKFLDRENL